SSSARTTPRTGPTSTPDRPGPGQGRSGRSGRTPADLAEHLLDGLEAVEHERDRGLEDGKSGGRVAGGGSALVDPMTRIAPLDGLGELGPEPLDAPEFVFETSRVRHAGGGL